MKAVILKSATFCCQCFLRVRFFLQPTGCYTITCDGRNEQGEAAASGTFLYQLRAGDFVQARRMALVR